jgi:DNA-binding MarR family transcriptional regulator
VMSTLHSEGAQTQRDLGQLLRIDPATMVWFIDHLEKKGLVQRGVHPKDRRAYLVELTSDGKTVLRQAARRLDRLEEEFLKPLSAAERKDLTRLLGKLFRSVTTQRIDPSCFPEKKGNAS